MIKWYNNSKLLNMKDKNGNIPEIYIAISNRGAGKTYGFAKYILSQYLDNDDYEVGIFTQCKQDLGNVAKGIFNAVLRDIYPDLKIKEVIERNNSFSTIYLETPTGEKDDKGNAIYKTNIFGYVLPLNSAPKLKEISSKFIDIKIMFFDEFQSPYIKSRDVDNFIDIHMTVARGGETPARYVPVILSSNSLSINNPFFEAMGINTKIQSDTKFYKGDGFVLERFINEDVAKAQKESGFNKAFKNNRKLLSNVDNAWLNDNYTNVCKPSTEWGRSFYICTLINGSEKFGIRSYVNTYNWYISRNIDKQCQNIYSLTSASEATAPLLNTSTLLTTLKSKYYKANLKFSDLSLKETMKNYL